MPQEKNLVERENIFVENDEEISSIIAKIKSVKSQEIALVVPRGSAVLTSLVNLKLIRKQAEKNDQRLALVTTDRIGQNLAAQADIAVYENIQARTPLKFFTSSRSDGKNDLIKIGEGEEKTEQKADIMSKKTLPSDGVSIHHFQESGAESEENLKAKPEQHFQPKQPDKPLTVPSARPSASEGATAGYHPAHSPSAKIFFRPKTRSVRWKILMILPSILTLGAIIWLFLPRAAVTFVVSGEKYSDNLRLEVNTNIKVAALEEMKIPGHFSQIEKQAEKEFTASGKKNVGEKARGAVAFKNSWSNETQTIPAGTTISRDNFNFLVVNDVTVPGATLALSEGQIVTNPGEASGVAEAKEPGETYNLASGRLNIAGFSSSKQERFYAENSKNFTGGSTREVKIISAEDLENASQQVRQTLSEEIVKEIQEKNPDTFVLPDAIEYTIISSKSSLNEGEEADGYNFSMKLRGKAIIFEKQTFSSNFIELVRNKLPGDKSFYPSPSDDIGLEVKELDIEGGRLVIEGKISSHIAPKIDEAKLKKAVFGKKLGEAKQILEADPAVQEAKIELSPDWLAYRLPYFSFQYQGKVEYREK